MGSQVGGYEDYLYPNKEVPVPLPEDFYKAWLAGDTLRPPSQGSDFQRGDFAETVTSPHGTEAIVDQLIRENQDLIEKEALKQAAAAALNVNAAQYSNLIPLSFDQEEFIRQEEEKRTKQREKLQNSLWSKK
ncbi:hypothetical protein TELCIR_16496 [Teladorsagia circumcincta]|uniref:Uncharacterized protein n=1 Tax=Teladorsagia circumcincta TaxID=45464 RepID=A0A2G9TVB1_TELCI|nr:hypothetical protein TELCIR_16496 [Teladorsagia circumcincta]